MMIDLNLVSKEKKVMAESIRDLLEQLNLKYKTDFRDGDVYFELYSNGSFAFSVDVRFGLTEFFLKGINFVVAQERDLASYKGIVLDIIESVVHGKYRIRRLMLGEKILDTELVFTEKTRFSIYSSIFKKMAKVLSPKKLKVKEETGTAFIDSHLM